jgi:hypothetical protein
MYECVACGDRGRFVDWVADQLGELSREVLRLQRLLEAHERVEEAARVVQDVKCTGSKALHDALASLDAVRKAGV